MRKNKLQAYCLSEAKERIVFAKKKVKDKKWLKMASEMSKEMVFENAMIKPEKLAKNICDYLKLRACAKGKYYGANTWIDKSAREKYKKITGKSPICRRR